MPERSWRCSTLFHQRSIWLRTMAGSSTKREQRGQQLEQMRVRAGDGGEELPAGEDGDALRCGYVGEGIFFVRFSSSSSADALLAEPRVDCGEQLVGGGGFGERKEQRFVERGRGALGLRDRTCEWLRSRRRRSRCGWGDPLQANRHRECRRDERTGRAFRPGPPA